MLLPEPERVVRDGEWHFRVRTADGRPTQPWEAIVPIFAVGDAPEIRCIGTGFFIHTSGIVATAAHVINERQSKEGLAVLHYLGDNQIAFRFAYGASCHTQADVGALFLRAQRKTGGDLLKNRVLSLTERIPPPNSNIFTWAFPRMQTTLTDTTASISVAPQFIAGTMVKEYRDGRDSVLLPGSCYEVRLKLSGGTSGGPCLDEQGNVFAINTSGIDDGQANDISFVSHVQRIGGLAVPMYAGSSNETPSETTISKLIQKGEIIVR
ncbi:MAG: serine protease [Bauldia sp.]